jgi:hypothetical protein
VKARLVLWIVPGLIHKLVISVGDFAAGLRPIEQHENEHDQDLGAVAANR